MKTDQEIKQELLENGFCIITDILNTVEIQHAKKLFYDWKMTVPNHDILHKKIDPHGIYKFNEVGQQEHAWYIRTNENVQKVFKQLWKTDELIVSFDGSCFIPENEKRKDKIWTHTDQAPNTKGLACYQGFVSLTDNCERTLVVYKGTHKYHETYFKEKNIESSKPWQLIDHQTLSKLSDKKQILNVPAGSLVLWDSRCFHQNQYGKPMSEERIVQYVCYIPKNNPKNTKQMKEKRLKYFKERRTTSHWPAPIRVNSLNPQTYGDSTLNIDYSKLKQPELEKYMPKILKLI